LGASGGVVAAIMGWAGARTQARTQLKATQLQVAAQHDAETIAQRRSAYITMALSVDAVRRQLRIVRRHIRMPGIADGDLVSKQAEVHSRLREMQAAEWTLRMMLSASEHDIVTELTNAVYEAHRALIEDVETWSADPAGGPSEVARYAAAAKEVQAQMMNFAAMAHTQLYTREVGNDRRAER
jgi:hypothetical protein